jgi:F-type H+-transporting ATPase subunit delta
MSNFRVASRYAKSLLDLSEEKQSQDQVKADMQLLLSVFQQSSPFRAMVKSPVITTDKKQEVFNRLFSGRITDLTQSFIQLVLRKGREKDLQEVAGSFISQYNERKGITRVTMTTAVALDAAAIEKITNKLKEKEGLKEIELQVQVKPELIGGFILQYGDRMIDSSISRRVNELSAVIHDDSYIKKYS